MITISKTTILPVSLFILAALFRISPETSFLTYLVLCSLAFVSVRGALWALVAAWFFSTLNPEIFAYGSYDTILRFVVILSAAIRVAYQAFAENRMRRVRFTILWVFFFGIFIVLHALLFSQIVSISILKGIMWTLSFLTTISGWKLLSKSDSDGLFRNIKQLSVVIAVISLVLSLTSFGYTRNETGLNGLLNHPQALGLVGGIFMTVFFSEMVSRNQGNIKNGFGFVLFSVVLILSESRTGGLAFLLSLVGMILISVLVYRKSLGEVFCGIQKARTRVFVTAMLVVMAAFSGFLGDRISSYVMKRSDASQISEVYEISRGRLINQSIENINNFPFTGIGFGVPSDSASLEITVDPIFGIPISAPIEKGLVVLSTTEELGYPGLLLLLVLVWLIFVSSIKSKDATKISLFLVIVFVNFGEAVFFSPGGTGLLVLVLLGWVVRSDKGAGYPSRGDK